MIKLLIMDVDGTLTDGKIYYSSNGEEFKSFNVKDGYTIKNILPKLNIIPVIITGRKSYIVEKRAKELNIKEIYQGISSKDEVCKKIMKKYNIKYENIIVVGDDFNDLELIQKCGFSACPNDAINEVKKEVDMVLKRNGGDGVIYELISEIKSKMMNKIISFDKK